MSDPSIALESLLRSAKRRQGELTVEKLIKIIEEAVLDCKDTEYSDRMGDDM